VLGAGLSRDRLPDPEILISYASVPFYFGGTSLLIVVSVTMDTVAQVQGYLLAHQYEGLIRSRSCGAAVDEIWVGAPHRFHARRAAHVSSRQLHSASRRQRLGAQIPGGDVVTASRLSIFALGILPYLSAAIIVQLVSMVHPD